MTLVISVGYANSFYVRMYLTYVQKPVSCMISAFVHYVSNLQMDGGVCLGHVDDFNYSRVLFCNRYRRDTLFAVGSLYCLVIYVLLFVIVIFKTMPTSFFLLVKRLDIFQPTT